MSDIGHNRFGLNENNKRALNEFVRRIIALDEEKAEIAQQQKDLKTNMKALGYDAKALNSAIRRYKMDKEEREEQEHLSDLYLWAMEEQI